MLQESQFWVYFPRKWNQNLKEKLFIRLIDEASILSNSQDMESI